MIRILSTTAKNSVEIQFLTQLKFLPLSRINLQPLPLLAAVLTFV